MKALRIVALAALSAPVFAQDSPPSASPGAPQGRGVEEVIVRGRTLEQLRLELEQVENAVYARFNELNGSDDFDIFCREQAPTGSNIPVRTCTPKFALDADERAAHAILHKMQGGAYGGNPQSHYARMQQKGQELTAEMARVAREDEQLLRELTRLAELTELQRAARQRRAER
jgi:hypothetical protein